MIRSDKELIFEGYLKSITEEFDADEGGNISMDPLSHFKEVIDDPNQLGQRISEFKAKYGVEKAKAVLESLVQEFPEQFNAAIETRMRDVKNNDASAFVNEPSSDDPAAYSPQEPGRGAEDLETPDRESLGSGDYNREERRSEEDEIEAKLNRRAFGDGEF
jgi:hypothetical protein